MGRSREEVAHTGSVGEEVKATTERKHLTYKTLDIRPPSRRGGRPEARSRGFRSKKGEPKAIFVVVFDSPVAFCVLHFDTFVSKQYTVPLVRGPSQNGRFSGLRPSKSPYLTTAPFRRLPLNLPVFQVVGEGGVREAEFLTEVLDDLRFSGEVGLHRDRTTEVSSCPLMFCVSWA